MKRNMKDWIASVIASKQRIAIPIMTHSGIELIGRTVYDAVTNGEIHYQAIQILSEKYPSAASSVIMDLTVEAEAFGAQVYFSENEIPSIVGRLVSTPEEIEKLKIPSLNTARLPEYIKATRLMAANASKPVLAGCIGPYSLSGRLYDMSEMMMAMYIDPDSIRLLLSKCTEFITSYCLALKDAGANGVFMAEPAAGLLSNEDCMEFSSRYIKQIVDAVQDDSFSVFLHNCGNTGNCTQAMVYTDAAAYHFGNKIKMEEALKEVPVHALAMGNLDPVSLFKMSSPEEMRQATLQLLEATSAHPNFVLSSGCDVPPYTPLANIDAFYAALEEFNAMRN